MVIIWKGLGIIVPILLVGIGYLVSLFYEDKTLGNMNLLGWSLFSSSIVFILIGYFIARPSEEERNETGKKLTLWRHTFFFLPILFWGIIFLILSIYLLFIYNPNSADTFDKDLTNVEESDAEVNTIHFYNPTGDTLKYVFADLYANDETIPLERYTSEIQYTSGESDQSYFFASYNLEDELIMFIQPKDLKNYDKNKFKKMKLDGDDYYLRKIKKPTIETNDVDDVWVLLDSQFKLALIDVTHLYKNGKLNKQLITKVNWLEKIKQKYTGDDIIEVGLVHPKKDGTIEMISPNVVFPEEISETTKIYFLMDYLNEKDLNNKFITDEIARINKD